MARPHVRIFQCMATGRGTSWSKLAWRPNSVKKFKVQSGRWTKMAECYSKIGALERRFFLMLTSFQEVQSFLYKVKSMRWSRFRGLCRRRQRVNRQRQAQAGSHLRCLIQRRVTFLMNVLAVQIHICSLRLCTALQMKQKQHEIFYFNKIDKRGPKNLVSLIGYFLNNF